MSATTLEEVGEDLYVSIPCGGPLYVPDMVGPLTRVSDFETSVFQELQSLKEELSADSPGTWDDEILVEELKILKEDELVDKAFEEAFKGGESGLDASQVTEENLSPRLIAKVEELAKIKQRQDEDKASVRLHSFNGGSKSQESTVAIKKCDKIKSLKSASVSAKVKSSNTLDNVPVTIPESILSFEVYHNKRKFLKTQEFVVLGRQFLTEIKDKIYCKTDEIMKKAGRYETSGYFLIEDVFCNDMRDYSSIDYSKPILDWIVNSEGDALERWGYIVDGELQQKQKALLGTEKKQRLPRFKAVPMQNTRFCDIRFRLGAGYLYCHQGDCKHVIVLRDMRLIHPEDVQNQAAYPLMTFQSKFRYMKCSVCKIYRAQKITVDDKWAPSNPCYFCDVCYYMLHYANGSLIYDDFSVYDYLHE